MIILCIMIAALTLAAAWLAIDVIIDHVSR